MLKVGITGGIGSGKTMVASIFEQLGIPVYYADVEAKRIMNSDAKIIDTIKDLFGHESYREGSLNKKWIADAIFSNPSKRLALNEIVHPATIAASEKWMSLQTTQYVLKEAALVFESGAEKHLDYVIGVSCSETERIARIIKRDNIDEVTAIARIKGQMNDEEKMRRCDFIIDNNEREFLTTQVIEIHEALLKRAEAKIII